MATYKITAPAPGYTGKVGKVAFADGCAEIDGETQAAELSYFRRRGYGVTEVRKGKDVVVEEVQAPTEVAPGTANGSPPAPTQPPVPTPTAEAVEEAKAAEAREADAKPDAEPDKDDKTVRPATNRRGASKGDAK